jgi:hypothetical protein
MTFPTINPSSRQFDAGDWPIKTYTAQSGAELRILYGSKRTGMKLGLSYDNITDTQAEEFLTHYDSTFGTYQTFTLPSQVRSGWTGTQAAIDAAAGNNWRYKEQPQVTAVKPGRSSVRVSLVGVL